MRHVDARAVAAVVQALHALDADLERARHGVAETVEEAEDSARGRRGLLLREDAVVGAQGLDHLHVAAVLPVDLQRRLRVLRRVRCQDEQGIVCENARGRPLRPCHGIEAVHIPAAFRNEGVEVAQAEALPLRGHLLVGLCLQEGSISFARWLIQQLLDLLRRPLLALRAHGAGDQQSGLDVAAEPAVAADAQLRRRGRPADLEVHHHERNADGAGLELQRHLVRDDTAH
mmetsp:Transcript_40822/g.117939  ORF Transcript_40822/g.117939 Transcript_40822/m.117939 type:complete len:230 (+) Transcript_40822:180-869(+)